MVGFEGGPHWRVFVSHTSELGRYPTGEPSYVDAVERAVAMAGHAFVDMRDFPSIDEAPADVCVKRVASCDVYVAILGTRYGSPVRDRPEVSYTELEFDTATTNNIHRLVFVVDTDADDLGLPPSALIDLEFGARQATFRQRVKDDGLTAQLFKNPDDLRALVFQSLRERADSLAEETTKRVNAGIEREQQPAEPQPVRETKFVNAAPMTAPASFQDRHVETGLLARFLADPALRVITVVGRGGIGKTAMVCRVLKGLEAGKIPDVDAYLAGMDVDGIVYLSQVGRHQVTYENLVYDLARLLPDAEADAVDSAYRNPGNTVEDVMYVLLEAFTPKRVVVLMDNFESALDPTTDSVNDVALRDALTAVLRGPEHGVKVIITTQVVPKGLAQIAPSAQRLLRLDDGLGYPDAETVLRDLDPDGSLGLRDAPDALLGRAREQTLGFPRALEAIKGILFDHSVTLAELLDQTAEVAADDVVRVLVGEAYQRLDRPSQRIMQALAIFQAPVSAVAIDYLLQPHDPTVNSAPILARLVSRALARRAASLFYLHPVDRAYALDQIPEGQQANGSAPLERSALRSRAAEYFAQIRTPRESWRSIDDLTAQLAEFDLRLEIDDYDTAATVLSDIEFEYLFRWGHFRKLVELHTRIHGHLTVRELDQEHLGNLGSCYLQLGDYLKAIDLIEQALAIARDLGHRQSEGAALGNLGLCYRELGDYPKAIDLIEQALAIARDLGHRESEGAALTNLGGCYLQLGDYPKAIDLTEQALAIARDLGDRQGEGIALGNLGLCYRELGDYPKAIDLTEQALDISRDLGSRQSEVAALSNLGSCYRELGDYLKAIDLTEQALAIAHDLGDRQGEGVALGNLGICYRELGDYPKAIDLTEQALAITRDLGDRQSEGLALGNLGLCYRDLGDYSKAIELTEQALAIARDLGDRYGEACSLVYLGRANLADNQLLKSRSLLNDAIQITEVTNSIEPGAEARVMLARAYLDDDQPAVALSTIEEAQELDYPPIRPVLYMLKGVALVALDDQTKASEAFHQAESVAAELLGKADSNIAALYSYGLALSGLALTGEPLKASVAAETIRRARARTSALGLIAEASRLFNVLTAGNPADVLVEVRAALEEPGA
jgi:tetratricopeptide (TPR) repeat protein